MLPCSSEMATSSAGTVVVSVIWLWLAAAGDTVAGLVGVVAAIGSAEAAVNFLVRAILRYAKDGLPDRR